MELFKLISFLLVLTICHAQKSIDKSKPAATVTRTEIKVSRSLNPEDTQTLNVMTRNGEVAQLIVKKRDPKSSSYHQDLQSLQNDNEKSKVSRAIYTNWIPFSSLYYQPNIIKLDTIALVQNSSKEKPLGNVIDSDRIPHMPNPITIRSGDVYVKNSDQKRGRSVVQIEDGIPVIHGVRVPDDESDRQTWRNARVINGELVPYEKDYKPQPAIPIGELIYASQVVSSTTEKNDFTNIGPFTKEDNFENDKPEIETENKPFAFPDQISNKASIGPFTKADNAKIANSKLIDYIKEINAKESKRDYFGRRKYRSYENNSQMQRRMLQYPGQTSYPNSLLYTPTSKLSPVTFNEGVRTPVLQYAHPELGVQPAKATTEDEEAIDKQDSYKNQKYPNYEFDSGRKSQYYDNNINHVEYYRKDVMNYPYNTYYIKPKSEQPFWIRITESIRDNVQNGFARMQQLTRPVFEPLVEATHKISHNLGFSTSPQRAQSKVGLITPIGGSVILPALGLVAGGAALGLGAAAVGRYLTPEDMRAFQGNVNPDNIVVIMEEPNQQNDPSQQRYKRSIEDEYNMQKLNGVMQEYDSWKSLTSPHFWSDTPCAKKLFCEVMLRQHEDEVVFMEKKMDSLMSRVHPEVASSVSQHLQEVMEAIKLRDCSKFYCNKRFPISAPAA